MTKDTVVRIILRNRYEPVAAATERREKIKRIQEALKKNLDRKVVPFTEAICHIIDNYNI